MTPFLGQGAVMALEDAMVFARAVQAANTTIDGLHDYEIARRARTAFVFEESRLSGEQLTSFNPDAYDAEVHRNEESQLTSFNPDAYDAEVHRNEESLDLAAYNAVTVPIQPSA
jgi:2-polyprenyl-6-methoxyphenol hydroxylase-like FAD-dependent oxidoreductase